MRTLLILVAATTLLSGCPKPCQPKAARCHGATVQVCRPDGTWSTVTDCSKVDTTTWDCKCKNAQTCRCQKP